MSALALHLKAVSLLQCGAADAAAVYALALPAALQWLRALAAAASSGKEMLAKTPAKPAKTPAKPLTAKTPAAAQTGKTPAAGKTPGKPGSAASTFDKVWPTVKEALHRVRERKASPSVDAWEAEARKLCGRGPAPPPSCALSTARPQASAEADAYDAAAAALAAPIDVDKALAQLRAARAASTSAPEPAECARLARRCHVLYRFYRDHCYEHVEKGAAELPVALLAALADGLDRYADVVRIGARAAEKELREMRQQPALALIAAAHLRLRCGGDAPKKLRFGDAPEKGAAAAVAEGWVADVAVRLRRAAAVLSDGPALDENGWRAAATSAAQLAPPAAPPSAGAVDVTYVGRKALSWAAKLLSGHGGGNGGGSSSSSSDESDGDDDARAAASRRAEVLVECAAELLAVGSRSPAAAPPPLAAEVTSRGLARSAALRGRPLAASRA